MKEFRADLHCHSTCSDGTYTPEELVRLAAEIGLGGLAITDHDTVDAFSLALPLAKSFGLELLPGIEFSTGLFGVSVHILGYGFQWDHPAIRALCEKHSLRRAERNAEILKNLARLGFPLDLEEVIPQGQHHTIGRPHIAQAMVNRGYVSSIQEAFKRYIGDGKPGFSRGVAYTPQETIEAVHAANGFAVIAHPHLIDHAEILRHLLEMPFDGIECFYAKFMRDQNSRWIQIADKKKWLKTGGSDFHGTVKPTIPLGASWVDQKTFHTLAKKG